MVRGWAAPRRAGSGEPCAFLSSVECCGGTGPSRVFSGWLAGSAGWSCCRCLRRSGLPAGLLAGWLARLGGPLLLFASGWLSGWLLPFPLRADISRFPGGAPVWLPPSLSLILPPFSLFCALSRLPFSPASLHSASRVGAPMSVLAGCLIGCLAGCCCPRSPLLLQSTSLFDLSPWPPLYCWLELLSLLASVFNQ